MQDDLKVARKWYYYVVTGGDLNMVCMTKIHSSQA